MCYIYIYLSLSLDIVHTQLLENMSVKIPKINLTCFEHCRTI